MKNLICDIDGVVADCTHRLKYILDTKSTATLPAVKPDWDAFFEACDEDAPIVPMIRFLQEIKGFRIIYVTGRPERTRYKTLAWFEKHGVPFGIFELLHMREDGDHRHDYVIKKLILETLDKGNIFAVIEDRDSVVDMWRGEGLLCLQPRKGDF